MLSRWKWKFLFFILRVTWKLLVWLHYREDFHSGFQLLDVDPNDQEEDGANIDLDSQRKGKCAVIKTSTRQVRAMCPVRCEEQPEAGWSPGK